MKRLIVCADGTWNQRDQTDDVTKRRQPTNVTKVARAVTPRDANGVDQVVFYHEGVGTGGAVDHITGGAFGDGMEANVRALYRFLLYNYADGDEIFLFGFSRGAFTVRTLAGFMNMIGLVEKADDFFVPEFYQLYQKGQRLDSPEAAKAFPHLQGKRRPCPPIKFIGVWDTVGSLGAPGALGQLFNRNKYKYHDISLNAHIENAIHALAIDERRKPFAPSLWSQGNGFTGHLEQARFAGVHSNVGGSCIPDGLANEALHWIVEKAEKVGLAVDGAFLAHYRPCFNATMQDSMSTMYKVLGPFVRPIGTQPAGNEMVHQAALDRMALPACAYAPANLQEYIARAGAPPTATTTRVARGKPC